MDYSIADRPTSHTMTPALKRAYILLCTGYVADLIIFIAFGFFPISIQEMLGSPETYKLALTICNFIALVAYVAGFVQLCFAGNKAYLTAGVILTVAYIGLAYLALNMLSYGTGVNVEILRVAFSVLTAAGIATLWLCSSSEPERIPLTGLLALSLFKSGFRIMNCYTMFVAHTYAPEVQQLLTPLMIIAELMLWCRFLREARPAEYTGPNIGVVNIVTSRPFIAYIVCGVISVGTLHIIAQLILA